MSDWDWTAILLCAWVLAAGLCVGALMFFVFAGALA
jgi:hypothetical protein